MTKWLAVASCPPAPHEYGCSFSLNSLFCTTTNFQGSYPKEEGDNLPVSKINLKSSSEIFA